MPAVDLNPEEATMMGNDELHLHEVATIAAFLRYSTRFLGGTRKWHPEGAPTSECMILYLWSYIYAHYPGETANHYWKGLMTKMDRAFPRYGRVPGYHQPSFFEELPGSIRPFWWELIGLSPEF